MKKVNSLQIKDQKAQLKKRAQEIIDTVKKEMRDLTNEESQEIENIKQLYLNYNTLQKAIEFLRGIKRIPAQITCEWRRYNKKFIAQNCYNAKRSFFK